MCPALCTLAHVALVTPDVERSLWFFRDLLGLDEVARDERRVYLRCFGELDHHSLTLEEGPTGVDHIAFRTAAADDVREFQRRFEAAGVEVTRLDRGEHELGQGEAIRFVAPFVDAPLELLYDIDKPLAPAHLRSRLPTNSTRIKAGAPRRLDHINLATGAALLPDAEQWIREQLGFKRREYIETDDGRISGSWLSVTSQAHDLALTIDVLGRSGRMNHVAFAMEGFADIARMADVVAEHDVQVDLAPGRHGITQGFFYYVRDPGSGHRIELYAGGYPIFDPDWTPVRWNEEDLAAFGLAFFGPRWTREDNPNAENTPCSPAVEAST